MTQFISKRNLQFLLYQVFDVLALTKHEYYQEHDKEMFDAMLDTSLDFAQNLFFPIYKEMDRQPPQLIDGKVRVHPTVRTILKQLGANGWIGAIFSNEVGGAQLPIMIANSCYFILGASNYSATVYPGLSKGAAGLILSFGSDELIQTYVPKLFSGEWQGTMALTEPQAGSSLSDITTTAEPTADGYYKLRGRKIFISAGDHDGVDNVVHLMLAKIKDAPAGVKGISLFVVPQKRIEDGKLVPNDVSVSEIYHKLGYRGAPITALAIGESDNCRGYLVGEPHKGLRYMFQMMNEARVEVGIGATAIASAAHYAALQYTQERLQGRKLTEKDPTQPQVPIIAHPDVKRMLLFQRAVIEGSLSLLMQCARYADLAKVLPAGEEKEKNELLLDMLTPIAKSYPSEMGILAVSSSLQCLGGYGYCEDFPIEQYFRDMRIHPIHEGTTGIHGQDLLGRKVTLHNGREYALYLDEVKQTIANAQSIAELKTYAQQLADAMELVQRVTQHLLGLSQSQGVDRFLADATVYLEFFGISTIAWQWLVQGIVAQQALTQEGSASDAEFYRGKLVTMQYFFGYELPKTLGLAQVLLNSQGLTVTMDSNVFSS